jgi:hypothetical protein
MAMDCLRTCGAKFKTVPRLALLVLSLVVLPAASQSACADLVTLTTSIPTGSANRDNSNQFIGILNSVTPPQIGGQGVSFQDVPAGESFQVGDLVGRNVDSSGGGRTWEYLLTLPGDATPGTGFENIFFSARAFENSGNNLEGSDQLTWQLFLNGSATAFDFDSPGAGVDFTTYDASLSHAGGSTINQVRVVMRVTGFDSGNEWFATRGLLSVNYTAVPEASPLLGLGLVAMALCFRFRRVRR